jgi:hypothetical protein
MLAPIAVTYECALTQGGPNASRIVVLVGQSREFVAEGASQR